MAGVGLVLVLVGLWMARLAPLLVMNPRVLPGGLDVTEHGPMDRVGTVVCVHSIFQGRESSWPIAQSLARRGLNAVNLHLAAGLDYNQYVRQVTAAADFYGQRGPVYLWGHSMGADLVAEAASQDPQVAATVAAGFPVTSPAPRLLLVVGAWDQLHSLPEMRALGAPLAVLPLSDHNQENFDPASGALAAEHFGRDGSPSWADPYVGRGLLACGLVLLCVGVNLGPLVYLLLVLMTWRSDPFHTVARGLLVGFVVSRGREAWLSRKQTLALLAALALGQLVVAWPNWTAQPSLLASFPLAMASWVPSGLMKFSADVPAWGWGLLFGLEVWRRGIVMRALCWLPTASWRKLGRLSLAAPRRVTPAQLGLLCMLLVGAGMAWWNVVQAGYWPDFSQWGMLASKIGGLVVTPLLVWVLAARRF